VGTSQRGFQGEAFSLTEVSLLRVLVVVKKGVPEDT
jgi:hypothetical protein